MVRSLDLCSRWDSRLFCNAGIDTGNIVESSRSRQPCVIPHAYTAAAASGSDGDDDEVTLETSIAKRLQAESCLLSYVSSEGAMDNTFLQRAQAGVNAISVCGTGCDRERECEAWQWRTFCFRSAVCKPPVFVMPTNRAWEL